MCNTGSQEKSKQIKKSPTRPFVILEPHDQEIGKFHVVLERRGTDFAAAKFLKGPLGALRREESGDISVFSVVFAPNGIFDC